MSCETKSFKTAAKEAKQRLKNGFWEQVRKDRQKNVERARDEGQNISKAERYFAVKVQSQIKGHSQEDEQFYQKVKEILTTQGEVGNAIGKLTDTAYFNSLPYDQKQRYLLKLSDKYLEAVSRFKKETEYQMV